MVFSSGCCEIQNLFLQFCVFLFITKNQIRNTVAFFLICWKELVEKPGA